MLGRTFIRFLRNERGNFMITFAAAVFAIAGGAGLALDMTRVKNAEAEAQDAADAAAMAAVVEYQQKDNKSKAEQYGVDMFDSNLSLAINGASIVSREVTIDDTQLRATASATIKVPTTLMSLFGQKSMTAKVKSEAEIGAANKPFELGVMLDVSGSMQGAKFRGLKEAVTDMASALLVPGGSTRIALAPFSSSVNAGSYASKLVGGSSSNNCVGERIGARRFTDATPRGDFFDVTGRYAISDDENDKVYREAYYKGYFANGLDKLDVTTVCPGSVILPLTNSLPEITGALDDYVAEGITAGHVGMYFAWYLVSENWRSFWPSTGRPSMDAERQKVVVLMTDGEFNTYYDKDNGLPNEQGSNICAQMKKSDYLIFAISFDTQGNSEKMLRECASKPEYFYGPDTVSELKDAFMAVADELKSMSKPRLMN